MRTGPQGAWTPPVHWKAVGVISERGSSSAWHADALRSAVTNARLLLELQAEFGGFGKYLWGFVDGRPLTNAWRAMADIPATTPVSDALGKDLKRRGFNFVGSTIMYAHMQATGMVNDHVTGCFRYREIREKG